MREVISLIKPCHKKVGKKLKATNNPSDAICEQIADKLQVNVVLTCHLIVEVAFSAMS